MATKTFRSTIVVTGGTTGLGYQCALAIAKQKPDALVLIASRSSGNDAAAIINNATGCENVRYLPLDLSSQVNIRKFAADFKAANHPPLVALVLNAGIQVVSGITFTKEGLETTFGVNHVGHALLFHLLAPLLSREGRVVITSSGTHDPKQKSGVPDALYETAELLAHPDEKSINNDGRQRYSTSKLCNVLWLYGLERRRKSQGVIWTVTAMDPGLMPGTGLARDAPAVLRFLWNHVLPRMMPVLRLLISPNIHTPEESGESLARLAIGKDVLGVSGKYYEGMEVIPSSDDSHDEQKQDELWSWTIQAISRDQSEADRFEHFK